MVLTASSDKVHQYQLDQIADFKAVADTVAAVA